MFRRWIRCAALAVTVVLSCGTNAQQAAASGPITFNQLAAWAEGRFPALFPGRAAEGSIGGYDYRYYADSGTYLAIRGTSIYLRGPLTEQQVLHIGPLHYYACAVDPALCSETRAASELQARFLQQLPLHGWNVRVLSDRSGGYIPHERLDGVRIVSNEAAAFGIGDAVRLAQAHAACESVPSSLGGYWLTWTSWLNDMGEVGYFCDRGPERVLAYGDAVYLQPEDLSAWGSRLRKVTDVQVTDVSGQRISSWLTWLPEVRAAAQLTPFPAGSSLMRVFLSPVQEAVKVSTSSPNGAFRSGATRLEDAFPFSGSCCSPPNALQSLNMADGTVTTINGRRVWYTAAAWPTYNALAEVNGRIYAAYYSAPTAGSMRMYFNATAKDAILNVAGP